MNVKIWFTVFSFFGYSQEMICQNNLVSVSTGLAPENKKYITENKAIGSIPFISNKSPVKRLPIALDQYLPSVLDQGTQGSCTAFAVAEALSIRENYSKKYLRSSTQNPQTLYSPTYLWVLGNKAIPENEDCRKQAISYSDAFSCIFNNKLVYWDSYPYPIDDANLCHAKCPQKVIDKKIEDKEFSFQDVILDTTAFKNLLKQGYPICIATTLDMGYYDALYNNKGNWIKKKLPQTNEQHAMVVVDYDDDIRCFKVLDSHGTKLSDQGIIWLSYDLINHNLDLGVVYGCYIVSFQKEIKQGPAKTIHYTSGSGLMIKDASFTDKHITGKILDKNGSSVAGATVTVKGTKSATSSDAEGNFSINASSNATLIISSVGFTRQEVSMNYSSQTVYKKNTFTTWTKQGYYRVFNGLRIGVIDLNKKDSTVLLSIADGISGKFLTNSIELKIGENVEFTVYNIKFSIKLVGIKHAGNLFNFANWYGAFLQYTLLSDNEVLTQYF